MDLKVLLLSRQEVGQKINYYNVNTIDEKDYLLEGGLAFIPK
jgi:hypothetical protein